MSSESNRVPCSRRRGVSMRLHPGRHSLLAVYDPMKNELSLKKLATSLSGAAGQYFVAGELSRRGIIATVTLRNARGIDILASNQSASRTISIQVKTNQLSSKKWLLDRKSEDLFADNLYYVFVNLNGREGAPTYHVVESTTVASYVKITHQNWLAVAKKDGSAKKDSSMRIFQDKGDQYLGAWDQLGFEETKEA